MRKILLTSIILVICAGMAFGQNPNSARTSGLTTVISELEGNTFTWTLFNNTGPGDNQPEWDVLIWSLQPFGLPDPVSVTAPTGWEWSHNGYNKFQIKNKSDKYESSPAVPPGGSLEFKYQVDLAEIGNIDQSNISFLAHVAAVKPLPIAKAGKLQWIATAVDGEYSWHDKSETPEPGAILPFLLGCSAFVGLTKTARKRDRDQD